jgi:hypothetical protein
MKRLVGFLVISQFLVFDLLACPYCVGADQSGKDSNTTLILSLFILSLYIPYIIIYRMIKKHKALREAHERSGSTNT